MPLHARQAGVWEEMSKAHARVAGTWRPLKVHVRVAGVWRAVVGVVNITDASYVDFGIGSAQTTVFFNSDGTFDVEDDAGTSQRNASTDWVTPNEVAGADFEIRVTSTGDALNNNSDAEGSWLSLGTSRQWGVTQGSGGGVTSATLTVQIRHAASGDVLDTGTITVEADTT